MLSDALLNEYTHHQVHTENRRRGKAATKGVGTAQFFDTDIRFGIGRIHFLDVFDTNFLSTFGTVFPTFSVMMLQKLNSHRKLK